MKERKQSQDTAKIIWQLIESITTHNLSQQIAYGLTKHVETSNTV